MQRTASRIVLAVCLSASAFGCARLGIQPPPDPSEVVLLPGSMVLMPVTDSRAEPYSHGQIRDYVRDATGKVLAKKGYVIVPHQILGGAARPPLGGISDLTGEELAALAPEGAEWLLFISVTRIVEGYGPGGDAFDVGVAGIVVGRDGSVLWRSAGSGRASKRGGLLRLFPPTPPAYNAAYDALRSLFAYIPKAEIS